MAGKPHMFTDKVVMFNDPPSPKQSLAERFPNAHAMFIYHGTKAKLRLRDPDDRDDDWSAQRQCEGEWSRMNMQTESEWAELRYRLVVKGDETYLRSASAAHLLRRGRARDVRREGLGPSQRWRLKESPDDYDSEDLEEDDDDEDEDSEPETQDSDEIQLPPLTRSVFRPIKHKYREVRKPKRTVCIRLPTDKAIKAFHVTDACRATMNSIQYSICEDAKMLPPDLCLVRLRHKPVARKLAGKTIRLETRERTHELRAWPYPRRRSQVFVAQVAYLDPNGIRIDSVHAGVLGAISRIRFHIRSCNFEDEMRCTLVLAFEQKLKYMSFSVGVQTLGGNEHLAHFEPPARRRACPVCRRDGHLVMECDWLEELSWWEVPESMKDGRYLHEPPEMV